MLNDIDSSSHTQAVVKGRSKLWQLAGACHCQIVGTCLTLQDVKSISKKCGYSIEGKTEYALHQFFVNQASYSDSVIARQTHKLLDKKYRKDINLARKLSCESDLKNHWGTHSASGKIAGTLWAVATHPECTSDLISSLYGEIHMLSHLSGHSAHQTTADLMSARQTLAELRQKLKSQKTASAQKTTELRRKVKALELLNSKLRNQITEKKAHPPETISKIPADRKLAETRVLLKESRAQQLQYSEIIESSRQKLDEQQQEITRLDHLVDHLTGKESPASEECFASLSGKCVLLLGGMPSQCKHFKAFVESHDGDFLHHDGGVESSYSRIDQLVSRADAVICPVEKVSHSAINRAKRLCRKSEKPLMFLPKSSLSAFVNSLQKIQ